MSYCWVEAFHCHQTGGWSGIAGYVRAVENDDDGNVVSVTVMRSNGWAEEFDISKEHVLGPAAAPPAAPDLQALGLDLRTSVKDFFREGLDGPVVFTADAANVRMRHGAERVDAAVAVPRQTPRVVV